VTPEEMNAYQKAGVREPRILVSDLDEGDHTLTTGYNLDGGGSLHAYVMNDEIHVLVYDHNNAVISYRHSDAMEVTALRPSKRAYPHTTNSTFAWLMRSIDQALSFPANFDWSRDWVREEMAAEPFKDKTHRNF
jgi:hypothetical protein